MEPATLALLLKGASQGIKTGSRLMQPKFGKSAYGRQLSYAKTHGNLSPGAEKTILNRVGNVAGRQADVTANRYMGGLINRGIQGSVSARRGLREAESDVRRTVSDTAKGIYVDEERAKSDAKMQYARGLDQDKLQRRQAWTGLITGGLDTASGIAGGLDSESKLKAKNLRADRTEMIGFLNSANDKEQFMTRLKFLQTQYPQFFEEGK